MLHNRGINGSIMRGEVIQDVSHDGGFIDECVITGWVNKADQRSGQTRGRQQQARHLRAGRQQPHEQR